MFKKFYRENGFYIITSVILAAVFFAGFAVGRYGTTAPSLEAIERAENSQAQSVSSVSSAAAVSSEAEQPSYNEITVTATAYCPCVKCSEGYGRMTATGATATAGRTIAVDPSVIPYGTEIIIDGNTYIAEDTGALIKGNKIDIFFDTHAETIQFGKRELVAYVGG